MGEDSHLTRHSSTKTQNAFTRREVRYARRISNDENYCMNVNIR
jgi:hypothetical protein